MAIVKDFWAEPSYAELLQAMQKRVHDYVVADKGTSKEALDLLVKRLEQRRGGVGVQDRAWMWVKSYNGGDGPHCARSLHHRPHNKLVAQVQPVKYTEGQHSRALDLGIVGSVKKAHVLQVSALGDYGSHKSPPK